MKNFFRKVAFGIGINDQVPSDPLSWALKQVDEVPELSWKGKIFTEKELRSHYRDFIYGDREIDDYNKSVESDFRFVAESHHSDFDFKLSDIYK